MSTKCLIAIALLLACTHITAQDAKWKRCGTWPGQHNVFSIQEIDGLAIVVTDQGMYSYDWDTKQLSKYNESPIADVKVDFPIITIADRAGIEGRLFAYTCAGTFVYSDDGGKNWNTTSLGAAAYTGIAVFDDGMVLTTTEFGEVGGLSFAPRGVFISTNNGIDWERLMTPHGDTDTRPIDAPSCVSRGPIGFYHSVPSHSMPVPHALVATFDGGKTWTKQRESLSLGNRLVGGSDSVVFSRAKSGASLMKRNLVTDAYKHVGFEWWPGSAYPPYTAAMHAATMPGDTLYISLTRTDTNGVILTHQVVLLNNQLDVIDSIAIPESARYLRRVGNDLWFVSSKRVGRIQGSTVSISDELFDTAIERPMWSAALDPTGNIIGISNKEIAKAEDCGIATTLATIPTDLFISMSTDSLGMFISTYGSYYRVDFATSAVAEVHGNMPHGFNGTYSRFRSVAITPSGRWVASLGTIADFDTIIAPVYISDDAGATWRQVRTGVPDRLIGPEGYAGGSNVVATKSGVLLVGIDNYYEFKNDPDTTYTEAGLYYSTDEGESWVGSQHGSPLNGVSIRSLAVTGTHAFALASKYDRIGTLKQVRPDVDLFASNDDGKTWSVAALGTNLALTGLSRITTSGDTLFIFDLTPSGGVRFSVDKGKTFKYYLIPVDGKLNWFSISGAGAVITTDAGVFVKADPTSVEEGDDDEGAYAGSSIRGVAPYPTPTNEELFVTIPVGTDEPTALIPLNASKSPLVISVEAFTSVGTMVADLSHDARVESIDGALRIGLNCSTLGVGTYVLRVIMGTKCFSYRILVAR